MGNEEKIRFAILIRLNHLPFNSAGIYQVFRSCLEFLYMPLHKRRVRVVYIPKPIATTLLNFLRFLA